MYSCNVTSAGKLMVYSRRYGRCRFKMRHFLPSFLWHRLSRAYRIFTHLSRIEEQYGKGILTRSLYDVVVSTYCTCELVLHKTSCVIHAWLHAWSANGFLLIEYKCLLAFSELQHAGTNSVILQYNVNLSFILSQGEWAVRTNGSQTFQVTGDCQRRYTVR